MQAKRFSIYPFILTPLRIALSVWTILSINWVHAQSDTTLGITLNGYVNVYADGWPKEPSGFKEFSNPCPRAGTFGLNIAQIGIGTKWKNLRSNITLHAGDIVTAVWDPAFALVQEANLGVQLSPKLGLDAGIFLPHIGGEGLTAQGQWFATNAVISYHEPYYQAGARAIWQPGKRIQVQGWILAGLGRIADQNRTPGLGWRIDHAGKKESSMWYAGYAGDERPNPDSVAKWVTYHNLGAKWNLGSKLKAAVSADIGTASQPDQLDILLGGWAGLRYEIRPKWGISARYEAFSDPGSILSASFPTVSGNLMQGLECHGFTAGAEFLPATNMRIRLEWRSLYSLDTDHQVITPRHPQGFQQNEALITWEWGWQKTIQNGQTQQTPSL